MWAIKQTRNERILCCRISFIQKFQNITGTLTMGREKMELSGKLDGDKISFSAGGVEYTGTVSGNTISGAYDGGGSWKATRYH
jgi:hypothetical protein